MNPLDLRGPEFLLFYLLLGVLVLMLLHWLIRAGEPSGVAQDWHLEDPYEIACLRAGPAEAVRVAMVALMDRGLLRATGEQVVAAPEAQAYVKRPLEREIADFFQRPRAVHEVFSGLEHGAACERYRAALAERGLLVGEQAAARRATLVFVAAALLVAVSATKIAVALQRGRHNILFLIVLTLVFVVAVVVSAMARRTAAGNALVKTLKSRFASLRARASMMRPGGATNELSYLAAAYGLAVLPAADFPFVKQLFPKATGADGSPFTGGCGSSGCGGGGGGGGCGGGCGGCGG